MSNTSIKTRTYKNYYNQWVVESTLLLDESKGLQLRVCTSKVSSGMLNTNASVSVVSEDGKTISHTLFVDYSKLIQSTKHKRVTLKTVEEQHALANWDSIIAEAKLHYNLV